MPTLAKLLLGAVNSVCHLAGIGLENCCRVQLFPRLRSILFHTTPFQFWNGPNPCFRAYALLSKTRLAARVRVKNGKESSRARRGEIEKQLGRDRLSKCDPEAVQVSNDELPHSIEGIVQVLDDVGLRPKSESRFVDIVHEHVQINFAAKGIARLAVLVEHQFRTAKRHFSPIDLSVFFVVELDSKSNRCVPLHRGTHVGHVDHGDNLLEHFALPSDSPEIVARARPRLCYDGAFVGCPKSRSSYEFISTDRLTRRIQLCPERGRRRPGLLPAANHNR